MAANFFEQVKSLAPPEVIERVAGTLGETPQATDRALTGAAMPAVLGGLVQQFSSGAGPARLLGLVKQQDPGGRLLDNMSAGLSGAAPAQGVGGAAPAQGLGEAERAGQGLIGTLFGQRGGQVADAVATHAGIKKTSATSLLSLAGVMTMGWLGQRVARGGLDANGLGSMLTNARGELGRIAPPGLAAAIGAPSAEPAATYAAAAAGGREAIYRDEVVHDEAVARKAAPGAPAARRGLTWLIPVLIVLGLLAWLLSRVHFGAPHVPARPTIQAPQAPTVPTAPTPQMRAPQAPTAQAPQVQAPAAPTTNAPGAPGQPPSGAGANLGANLAPNSPVAGLANYLANSNASTAPQRFTLRNMSFPTAGSTLSDPSQRGLDEVAATLKAHPNARVQVQGFTDDTGAAQANLALSQQRADAVRTALIQRGVAPNRVTARGFGASNPVASNATPAGRAENRRTDLLVASG